MEAEVERAFSIIATSMDDFVLLSASAQKTLVLFARKVKDDGVVYMSRAQISTDIDVSSRTVHNTLDELKKDGWIAQFGYRMIALNMARISIFERPKEYSKYKAADFKGLAERYAFESKKKGAVASRNFGHGSVIYDKANASEKKVFVHNRMPLTETQTIKKSDVDAVIKDMAGGDDDF